MKFKYQENFREIISRMPPLHYTLPGEKFDIEKSQVIKWLIQQPEILDWLYMRMVSSRMIKYNPDTQKWVGVNYDN